MVLANCNGLFWRQVRAFTLILGAFFAAEVLLLVQGHCPNSCSGKGKCTLDDKCECFRGYGYVPDCSKRWCPFGPSWADAPFDDNAAHAYSECSSKGTCDRTTGQCKCFDGYTGSSCQRMDCPSQCSGKGVCYTLRQAAEKVEYKRYRDDRRKPISYKPTFTSLSTSLWDADRATVCLCDDGYEGIDCSIRTCPRGDDPLTDEENHGSVQYIVFGDGVADIAFKDAKITYYDLYGGEWSKKVQLKSDASATLAELQKALLTMPNARLSKPLVTVVDLATLSPVNELTAWDPVTRTAQSTTYRIKSGMQQVFQIQFQPTVSGESGAQFSMSCELRNVVDGIRDLAPQYTGVDGYLGSESSWGLKVTEYKMNGNQLQLNLKLLASSHAELQSHLNFAQAQNIPLHVDFITKYVTSWAVDRLPWSCALYIDPWKTITVSGSAPYIATIPIVNDGTCPPLPNSDTYAMTDRYGYAVIGSQCLAFQKARSPSEPLSENAVCSNRGFCNDDTGLCSCYPGYRGDACSIQDALV